MFFPGHQKIVFFLKYISSSKDNLNTPSKSNSCQLFLKYISSSKDNLIPPSKSNGCQLSVRGYF